LLERAARVRVHEQRPVCAVPRPSKLLVIEARRYTTRPRLTQARASLDIEDGATAGGDDDACTPAQLIEHVLFARAKTLLALRSKI
jgi:hypothetical protein